MQTSPFTEDDRNSFLAYNSVPLGARLAADFSIAIFRKFPLLKSKLQFATEVAAQPHVWTVSCRRFLLTQCFHPSSKLLPRRSGLGISGSTSKDGSESFDGFGPLGFVSIKSSAWCHDDLPQLEILQKYHTTIRPIGFCSRIQSTTSIKFYL